MPLCVFISIQNIIAWSIPLTFKAALLLFQFNYQASKQYYAFNKDLLIAIAKVFNKVRGKLTCGTLCPVGGINTDE